MLSETFKCGLPSGECRISPSKLRRCVFELDYCCNLKCQTCNIWRADFNKHRGAGPHSLEQQMSCLEHLLEGSIEQFTFLGGEPLLNQHLWALLGLAGSSGAETALVTNGTLLHEINEQKIFNSGLKTLIVSLDGPPAVHDKIRGCPGTFERLFESILRIQKRKKVNGLAFPRVLIYTTVSSLNSSALPDLLPYVRRLDVNGIRFQLVSVLDDKLIEETKCLFEEDPIGYHSYEVHHFLRLSNEEFIRVRAFLAESEPQFRKWGINLQLEGILSKNEPVSSCRFILSSVVINPSGEVLPCPMLPSFSLGNCNKQSTTLLWGNVKHQFFLNQFVKNGAFPVCRECCVEKIRV